MHPTISNKHHILSTTVDGFYQQQQFLTYRREQSHTQNRIDCWSVTWPHSSMKVQSATTSNPHPPPKLHFLPFAVEGHATSCIFTYHIIRHPYIYVFTDLGLMDDMHQIWPARFKRSLFHVFSSYSCPVFKLSLAVSDSCLNILLCDKCICSCPGHDPWDKHGVSLLLSLALPQPPSSCCFVLRSRFEAVSPLW